MQHKKYLLALAASLLLFCPAKTFGQSQNLKGIVIDKALQRARNGLGADAGKTARLA